MPLRQEQIRELEVHDEETVVLRDRRAKLGDGVVDVLPRPVHLAEPPVPLRVVRVQLDGARRVPDRVVVVVDLERVLRHPLVELPRPLRLHLRQPLEHRDRVGDLALLDQHSLEREVALGVARGELDDPPERGLRVGKAAQMDQRLRERATGLEVRGRGPELPAQPG